VIADRLADVRARIEAAAIAAGRAPDTVGLVAVSKRHPPEAIREAYAAGQRDFGENYAQELRDKAVALADLPDIRWHFVGRIQTNKVKYFASTVARVHAIDRVDHAVAIGQRAGDGPVGVLAAINLADEATKSGVAGDEALALCRALHAVPGIALKGLMTMPPPSDDPEAGAPEYARLAALAERGRAEGLPLHELSMGMSGDYEVAIRHGATWVRVGTAIFGPRG